MSTLTGSVGPNSAHGSTVGVSLDFEVNAAASHGDDEAETKSCFAEFSSPAADTKLAEEGESISRAPASPSGSHAVRNRSVSVPFVSFTDADEQPKDGLWSSKSLVPPLKRRPKQSRITRKSFRSLGAYRNPSTLSVLDLATTDLDKLKLSFVAHAAILNHGDLNDMQKLVNHVEREMRYGEQHLDRSHRGRQGSKAPSYQASVRSEDDGANADGGTDRAWQSLDDQSSSDVSVEESVKSMMDVPSQTKAMLCTWIYDRYVQQRIFELRAKRKARPNDTFTAVVSRQFPDAGTKELMVNLRNAPKPRNMRDLDLHDGIGSCLNEAGEKVGHTHLVTDADNLVLPLPVFVYVLSRALFRLHYLDRFPAEAFSVKSQQTNQGASCAGGSTPRTEVSLSVVMGDSGSNSLHNVSPLVSPRYEALHSLLQEAVSLLEECRRVAMQGFDIFDTEQKGVISWSVFTDALTECMEEKLRGLCDQDCGEDSERSGVAVFDDCVVEPFPSMLRRLGYVRAVTKVRHNPAAVLVEGTNDFAVCDSSYHGLIQRKLLVRSSEMLLMHCHGATDAWDPERWDIHAGTGENNKEQEKFTKGYVLYEDGRLQDGGGKQSLLFTLQRKQKKEQGLSEEEEDERKKEEKRTDQNNYRNKPTIECCMEVKDVGPNLPKTIITLTNDLIIRFYNMDQHIWVVPESLTMNVKETICAMDWCAAAADENLPLKGFLFVGTRSGKVIKLDLQAILRRMISAQTSTSDIMTTGIVAASTVRDRFERRVVQEQKIHSEVVTSVCLTASDMLLTSSLDGAIVLSRASTMTLVRSFRLETGGGVRLAYITPTGNAIVTLSSSNRVSLWGTTHQSSRVDFYDPISPHYFQIASFIVDESLEQLTTVDTSGHIKVWSLRTALVKFSFYAVSEECMNSLGFLSEENMGPNNGFRLFDVDDAGNKRLRVAGDTGSRALAAILQTSFAKLEDDQKRRSLHPIRTVAYDAYTRRLFVSGAKNNLVCVFISGSVAMKTHSSPPLYVGMCERNRWLVSVSPTDCRVWDCQSSKLVVGFKVNNPEFLMARLALTFASRSNLPTDAQLANAAADLERYKLDECKQPLPTINDVIRVATERADLARRENSRAMVAQKHEASTARDAGGGSRPSPESNHQTARGLPTPRFAAAAAAGADNSGEDDVSSKQMATHRVICAHVDAQERFVFYALGSGDVRMHRIKSGQLVKTLLTMSPSTELIYAAVLQCRHMYTYTRNPGENRHNQDCDDVKSPDGYVGAHVGVHDVAFVLQRLLREGHKLPLERSKTSSVHREVVGMMTPRNSHELCVVYVDGVIRFFPLLGSSVHAHRIIIPEFLVSKALSYLRMENTLMRKEAANRSGRTTRCTESEAAEAYRNVMVEADAVSFITVSHALNLVCLVQVNGRVSLMGMGSAVGMALQVFYVASEVSTISFLGGYPCLVVGEVQGTVGFYLLKGASFLDLFDNFYKALLLYRRQQQASLHEPSVELFNVDKLTESSVESTNQHGLNSTPCVWWFRVPGAPTTLHFDPHCCSLYVGTQQGFVTSYLVRNLIVAANLHPASLSGRSPSLMSRGRMSVQGQSGSAEVELCNVLLVFFNLTPDRVMRTINRQRNDLAFLNRRRRSLVSGSAATVQPTATDDSTDEGNAPSVPKPVSSSRSTSLGTLRLPKGSSNPEVDGQSERPQTAVPLQSWRPSLLWIYDSCRSLFHPHPTSTSTFRGPSEPTFSLLDLATVTLSDLLLGAAILHYVLQLMQTQRSGQPSSTDYGAMDGDQTTKCAAMINSQDLRHIRQCILEELHHRKSMFEEINSSHPTSTNRVSNCHIEEFVETIAASGELEEGPAPITGDWVELLFRRHAVNTVSSSPLTLLSMEAIIERARRERRERVRILMKYVDERRLLAREGTDHREGGASSRWQHKSISVNWNAFLEGAPPDCITEALRRCHEGASRDEEVFFSEDNNAVQCITTRRNGVLYVGSADGSVSVWTPYACARLQEFSPCNPLDAGIRRIGEFVKTQFTKQWKSAENLRQRKAYASGTNKQKLHEAMMRNITLKYRVALLKQGAKRGGGSGVYNSPGGGNSSGADGRKQASPRRAMSHVGFQSLGSMPTTLHNEMQNLIKKPKELLMAALPIDESEMDSKGIIMEDLYFLPMQMSVLSELEDLDGKAYAAAVDLSVARLLRDVCCSDGQGLDPFPSARYSGVLDRVKLNADESQTFAGAGPPLSATDVKRGGEAESAVDTSISFFISSHEKHMTSFYVEAKRKLDDGEYTSQHGNSLSRTGHSVTFISLHSKLQRPPFSFSRTQDAKESLPSTPDGETAVTASLPQFAQAGVVGRPGVIVVALSERREGQLNPQFEFDLPQLAANSQWIALEEALKLYINSSDGALTMDSFQCVSISPSPYLGRGQRVGDVSRGSVQVPPIAGILPSILTKETPLRCGDMGKGVTTLADPLLVMSPSNVEEDLGLLQSEGEPQHLDRTRLRRGSSQYLNANANENTATGKRCSFFFTETHDLRSPTKTPSAISTTAIGGKWSETHLKPFQEVESRRPRPHLDDVAESGRGSMHPTMNIRWTLESKQQNQRAKLSRTGRTVLTPPRSTRDSRPRNYQQPLRANGTATLGNEWGVNPQGFQKEGNSNAVDGRAGVTSPNPRIPQPCRP
ncbi:uncharacterized protein TEOVI_000726500 [Trypanosoma equiperdum]|uniref:EF-hand domain-containing protein n=1 Tax=Trypanosoma equiperdum TaxID=5694 RepID=A0A1G4IAM5_TRYEQ|nr:hypothetical protein, conserved [Trypanosoma equiperdum]